MIIYKFLYVSIISNKNAIEIKSLTGALMIQNMWFDTLFIHNLKPN